LDFEKDKEWWESLPEEQREFLEPIIYGSTLPAKMAAERYAPWYRRIGTWEGHDGAD